MKTFPKGGIHPKAMKLTADTPIRRLQTPPLLTIITSQCIGAPSKPIVKMGEEVAKGQMIAEAGGFVGAPLHSPVAGTVKKLDKVRDAQGLWRDAIIIEPTAETEAAEQMQSVEQISESVVEAVNEAASTPADIIRMVGDAGVVGLGGATFPTRVKLSVPDGKHADMLIINGAECEPYLTCDDRLMREQAEKIVKGITLLAEALGQVQIIIGIEENKPEAIEAMRGAAMPEMRVEVLKKKYPQGGEKQLIKAVTGREVPDGGLPIDVGCIVDNVATAYAVADAVAGVPLTERVVTVTGDGVENPGNFLVKIGTPISAILDAAGGLPENAGKVVAGGPMMGRAVSNLEAPSTKGLSGILVISEEHAMRKAVEPCIRCARCVEACPMGLEPYLYMPMAQNKRWEDVKHHGAMSCIECGSCSYVCPAHRPLLDYIKLSKSEIKKNKI